LLVSFIIPLFNNLALTRACVDSLQATLPAGLAHEIILVDDGSTDGTREWLATLAPPFRVVLNERNLGYATANNRAAAVAQGEFLALLNNDLVLLPNWFDPLLGAHRCLGGAAGLIGNVQLNARTGEIDHTGILINRQVKPEHDHTLPSGLRRFFTTVRRVPAVTGACLLVERQLWHDLGAFDDRYINGGEDIDLCFRARAVGRVNAVALTSVVRHHVSASVGRKLHDEQNSHRLACRWRKEFVAAADDALRDWCRQYFDTALAEPRNANRQLALHAWSYLRGLTHTPPPEALDAVSTLLDLEFARWEDQFGFPRPPG
jgi:GT2 family glycosyltransferase